MSANRRTSRSDPVSTYFEFALGLALCAGAGYLLYIVDYWSKHGVNVYLHDMFVFLHHCGGKWIVAGLGIVGGLMLCGGALCRRKAVSKTEPFNPGTMLLESSQWMNPANRKPPSKTTSPNQ